MNFETLKKSHLKRNIIIGVVAVLIISAVVLNFTRAKYRVTQSIPLVNGTINYSLADINIVALYIDGVEADELDSTKQYTLDTSQSTCTYKDGSPIDGLSLSYDSATGQLNISPFTTKGTKCTLYFEEKQSAKDIIIANSKMGTGTPDFGNTSCTNGRNDGGNCNEQTVGLYEATTSKGTTYYYRGDVEDNYLVFADKYWRIIRINEDGTIRIIYSGEKSEVDAAGKETVLANGYNDGSTDYTQIAVNDSGTKTSAFNYTYRDNAYVGYMRGINSGTTSSYNQAHSNTYDSTIKKVLDEWYNTNLASYEEDYIDGNAGFCGDRSINAEFNSAQGLEGYGYGTSPTVYGAYERIVTNGTASLECSNSTDLYTTSGSSDGNKALTNPIGLITADEVAYAGLGGSGRNTKFYLYTGNYYWTMSPSYFNSGYAVVFVVNSDGYLGALGVGSTRGVRPVINLKADVTITGGGTINNPYTIS